MTTIVFVEKKDHIEVAYDSKVSLGYSHAEMENNKVFESSGIIYGVAGALNVANVIEGMDVKPPKGLNGNDLTQWVSRVLIRRMREMLKETSPEGQYYFPGAVLVGVCGKVYEIGSDYSRTRNTSGKYAIGSGSHFAKGALDAGASAKDAVNVAANNDSFTGHTVKSFTFK